MRYRIKERAAVAAALAAMGVATSSIGNWVLLGALAVAALIIPEYAVLLLVYGIAITAVDSAIMAIIGLSDCADRLADAAIVFLAVYALLIVFRAMRQYRPLH